MLRTVGRYTIALLAGALIVAVIPWLLAGIAAVPGLRLLVDGIRDAGLPVQYVFPLMTHYLPDFFLAFAVGFAVFKVLRGHRGRLLATILLPWLALLVQAYIDLCLGTDFSCFGSFPFHDFAGILDVPLGLALAAFIAGPPRPGMPLPVARFAAGSGRASPSTE